MNRRKLFILLAGLVFIACDIAILTWYFTRTPYQEPKLSFDGSSDQLQHTVIVPTLDTPIPEGKNAIWCASFQIAWNKLKTDVAKGPVQIQGAEEIAKRLNDSPVSEADLPEGSYYAAAGLASDGIVSRIRREMAHRFPQARPPEVPAPAQVVSYAYLNAGITFAHEFKELPQPLEFSDSSGHKTSIRGFGTPDSEAHSESEFAMRDQVEVLFSEPGASGSAQLPGIFGLDVSRDSGSTQLVLACVPRKSTMVEMLNDFASRRAAGESHELHFRSQLRVPNLDWRVHHRYQALENDTSLVLSSGPVLRPIWASQLIRFQLDRKGVRLESEGLMAAGGGELAVPNFHFNRPFLILLKKRGGAQPFFVMWVDNAELLQKWGE